MERQNFSLRGHCPWIEYVQTHCAPRLRRHTHKVCKLRICKLTQITTWGRMGTCTRLLPSTYHLHKYFCKNSMNFDYNLWMPMKRKITIIKYLCISKWVCRSISSGISVVGTGYIYHMSFYVQHLSRLFQLFVWHIPGLTASVLNVEGDLYVKDKKPTHAYMYCAYVARTFTDSALCVRMNAHTCT